MLLNETALTVQVLGSGGPELTDQRASTSYLISIDGKARVLLDTGPGSSLHFESIGADFNDIDALLYSHFHVDHSADLPAYVKASYFSGRKRDLPIYGPTGNTLMPSTREFVEGLFGRQGVYRYLQEYYEPKVSAAYKLKPYNIEPNLEKPSHGEYKGECGERPARPHTSIGLAYRIGKLCRNLYWRYQ